MVHLSHDPDVKVFLAVAWNWTHPWGTQLTTPAMQHISFSSTVENSSTTLGARQPVICILLPNCVMWHDIHIWLLFKFLNSMYKTNHKFLEKKPTLHYRNSHRISNKIETWNLTAEWHLLEVIERGLTNEIFTSVSLLLLLNISWECIW